MRSNFLNILNKKYNITLNEQQNKAVLHKEGPSLVLAVPGAGKTTLLICRTANLILSHNINPNSILSLTFSKASAKDMENRFLNIFGDTVNKNVHFSTIHSFAYNILKEYAYYNRIKFTLIETINKEINKNILIKNIYKEVNNSIINEDKLDELLNTIGYVKNMMLSDKDIKNSKFGIRNFHKIYSKYEDFKRKNNYIDFDDMLTLTFEILNNNSNILEKYRNKYKYIQIDEGQDTSNIQYEIIKLLAYPNNNLFIVADDDQSIYGFRGAYPENLLRFKDTFTNANTFFMEENFRSSFNIVSVCNDFIKTNKSRYKKNLFTNKPSKRPINIIKFNDEFGQLSYIVDNLKNIKNLKNTAILFRNNISSIGLLDELNKHGIPFYMRDSKLHFFNHWAVSDIKAFINLSLDSSDINSFEKVYYKMNAYISKKAIHFIMKDNKDLCVFDRLIKYPEYKTYQIDNIVRLKFDFKYLVKKSPSEVIDFILYDLNYLDYLKENSEKFGYSYDNIKVLLSNLKIIASNSTSITNFLDRLDSLKSIIENSKDKSSNSVRITTIHSSKGLEFDNVFMFDLIDGEFPSYNNSDSKDEEKYLEEERRLFYVGMTRARNHLDLITIKSRNKEKVFQSRFLDELEKIVLKSSLDTDFIVGAIIEHEKFGKGFIKEVDEDNLLIHFENIGIKQISLKVSLENNLINAI